MNGRKLYLVTRKDMRPGAQAAQLAHGLAQFAVENHDSFLQWNKASNTVVCLAVQDEEELTALHSRLDSDEFFNHDHLIDFATFREPDMNDSLTCIALMSCPCDKHRDVCIDIPLSHA